MQGARQGVSRTVSLAPDHAGCRKVLGVQMVASVGDILRGGVHQCRDRGRFRRWKGCSARGEGAVVMIIRESCNFTAPVGRLVS